jgi:hypothetical protein
MQRIDLRSALMLILIANAPCEIEQKVEAIFQSGIAGNLAADVADDAAEPCAQELERAAGALELVCVNVTPHHDCGPFGHAPIALAQRDALAFGKLASFSIARWQSLASVGWAIAFSCTVVSTSTRSRSLFSIAPVRRATERLSCSERLCERWLENPYFQYFCGEVVFRHEAQFDRSSLTRWRQRLGEEQLVALRPTDCACA